MSANKLFAFNSIKNFHVNSLSIPEYFLIILNPEVFVNVSIISIQPEWPEIRKHSLRINSF